MKEQFISLLIVPLPLRPHVHELDVQDSLKVSLSKIFHNSHFKYMRDVKIHNKGYKTYLRNLQLKCEEVLQYPLCSLLVIKSI